MKIIKTSSESIFLRSGIFSVILLCILILSVDVWDIYSIININSTRITKWWIIFLAIIALFWAGWRAKLIYEKIGCYTFAISFFLKDISQFAKKEVMMAIMFFCVVLDIGATISLWLCYKKFFQKLEIPSQQLRNLKSLKIPVLLLTMLLMGIIIGVFSIWVLHMIKQ